MNKRKILTFITALTMSLTSLSFTPAYVVAEDSTAAVSGTETNVVKKKGDIAFNISADLPSMYTGDEPNLDDCVLWVKTYDNMGYSSILHDIGSFTVDSGRYSDLYTIDTSEVDNTQEGKYLVTLKPKAGASFRETSEYDTTFDITMQGKESYSYIMVYDKDRIKDTPIYLRFYTEDIEITRGLGMGIELCGAMASDVRYEIEDETIAKVSENSGSKYLFLEALKEGETTVNVYTSDGRTTSEKIRVTPQSATTVTQTPPVTTTTTLADPNATTTRQTTTTIATVYKWWYDYSSYTTTTAVYTMPATTTTAIGCWAPKIEFDTSPMEIGEVREGRFYNPETKRTENGAVHTTSNNIKVEYTKGSDTFKVTALKAGSANISFYEKECALSGSLNITVSGEPEPPVSQTTTLPTVTTTTTTTDVIDHNELNVDFAPTVDFETSDMKVGETRKGRFYNPISEKSTGGNIKASDNVSVKVEKDGSFEVTALKAGPAGLEITDNDCPFTGSVYFNVVEVSKMKGDSNCDGQMDMSDVVLIMQALANPNKYGENGTAKVHLTAQGKENADMDGNGLTVGDAQKIQLKLLGLDDDSEPLTPLAQAVGVDTTDEAIKLIRSYDLNDYNVNARETMKQMFESFKKDGFIYRFAEVTGDDAVKLRDDYVNPPVLLGPYANFEDIGILYHVKAYDMNYQLYYFNRGNDYAGQSMAGYIKNRFGFNVTKVIDDKYFIFDSSKDGQNDISVIFALDDGHYCKVRCFGSEAELMKLAKSLKSVKLPLGEKKITDLNDVNALLIAYETEHKLPVSMITSISQGDKQVYVYLGTFDIKEQEKVIEQMKNYMKFMNIDEELVCFAIPQIVAD
ncbi:dockerin type I repeat-containing protein [Ruminococcus flavefaciens]|uniref:dockerin type I repeat-containing protein n=1 Tax=Ruminococcus flavefaciens TaxID=1265 RepID=UPI000491F317|nr:dockerin type I repeat-containing protein [Ruminococcus flavefaciens]